MGELYVNNTQCNWNTDQQRWELQFTATQLGIYKFSVTQLIDNQYNISLFDDQVGTVTITAPVKESQVTYQLPDPIIITPHSERVQIQFDANLVGQTCMALVSLEVPENFSYLNYTALKNGVPITFNESISDANVILLSHSNLGWSTDMNISININLLAPDQSQYGSYPVDGFYAFVGNNDIQMDGWETTIQVSGAYTLKTVDKEGNVLEDCQITVNNQIKYTDLNGLSEFSLPQDTYLIQVIWKNTIVFSDLVTIDDPEIVLPLICDVYTLNFQNSFKDNIGNPLQVPPSSFRLQFPNGTLSKPFVPNQNIRIQKGQVNWKSIIWQGNDITPEYSFDAENGDPTVNCYVYSLTIPPTFTDNSFNPLSSDHSWVLFFPNGTSVTYYDVAEISQTQNGTYRIQQVTWQNTDVSPETQTELALINNYTWSPEIQCKVYSLALEFTYDNQPITVSNYKIEFPNGTITTLTSDTISQTPIGTYIIQEITLDQYNITPNQIQSYQLASNYEWTIECQTESTLSSTCNTETSYLGFNLDIIGNLLALPFGSIENEWILLEYTVPGTENWYLITSAQTQSDGSYQALWSPSATGYYTIKASWMGNENSDPLSTIFNIAVTPHQETYVFSVLSNSTVSALVFDSVNFELRFTVSGETGTRGHTQVNIAEDLISNVVDLDVYLDASSLLYTADLVNGVWNIDFIYDHSVHDVIVSFDSPVVFMLSTTEFTESFAAILQFDYSISSQTMLTSAKLRVSVSIEGVSAITDEITLDIPSGENAYSYYLDTVTSLSSSFRAGGKTNVTISLVSSEGLVLSKDTVIGTIDPCTKISLFERLNYLAFDWTQADAAEKANIFLTYLNPMASLWSQT